MTESKFNENMHNHLINILCDGGFVYSFMKLGQKYKKYKATLIGINFERTAKIFSDNGASIKKFKRWKMIEFDEVEIGQWVWTPSIVIKKGDWVDPMLSGVDKSGTESVGDTWRNLAIDASERLQNDDAPTWEDIINPKYDGTMECMERMVPDLIALFGEMKEIIRHGWSNQP
ncbi:hypothetical protein [Niveispirillum sp. BGYR6]|uniref:hypothetical protein n=1 Tax=Niveispirillum sp. BGYR6 TaxID=2971249 RepID=UPI0022B9CB72|nr:hypothetical protein [Niveispirillum sp. BGYR6]MDG5494864.1 hypothetical protein [Niveispirillum sp. BGYR6]